MTKHSSAQIGLAPATVRESALATIPINCPLEQEFASERIRIPLIRIAALHIGTDRAAQNIIFVSEGIEAAIPGADRLACDVVQHPAFARFHTRLAHLTAQHVVLVAN